MAEDATGVQQAVQRALSEALRTIQRQLTDVQDSFEQVKGALEAAGHQGSAERVADLLPPLMHMQAAGAALAASIESVLRFVGVSAHWKGVPAYTEARLPVGQAPAAEPVAAALREEAPVSAAEAISGEEAATPVGVEEAVAPQESAEPVAVEEAPPAAPALDIESLPNELKQLHKKAKRFAKVTVQELMMYKKNEVTQGRQDKDLYQRFKDEIDRSKALYDKRFDKIAGHNIDYLYDELVRVLAENDPSALGDYPYSPLASRS